MTAQSISGLPKKTFQVALPHAAATDETKADFFVRAGFTGTNAADERRSESSRRERR